MLVVNKIDGVADRVLLGRFGPDGAMVSARTGEGLAELSRRVAYAARQDHEEAWLRVPLREGSWLARLNASAEILESTFQDSCCILRVRAPKSLAGRLRRFTIDRPTHTDSRP